MGTATAVLKLSNPSRPDLAPIEVEAVADTGATHLVIPRHVAIQLALDLSRTREVELANGQVDIAPYAGPIEVVFGSRSCYVGALVMGNEVLLGAIPMEDMDLVVLPGTRIVAVNPQSPNVPRAYARAAGSGTVATLASASITYLE